MYPLRHALLVILLLLVSDLMADEGVANTSHNQCPKMTDCPFGGETCADDGNCSADSSCCETPCGRMCVKQLRTGCETLRSAASRRAKALGVDTKSVRSPRCSKSGNFEPVQCDNEIVSSCWCVDEQGFELAGTRAPAASLVNCTDPKPCASHTCRMFCPHGFTLAADGCPLCQCRDPCDDVNCPNSLDCQIEELACSDPPCPPIPTCKRGRSLDNICPLGDPLRISDTIRPFLCGNEPSKPSCPPMYKCLVQQGNDYGVCCPASLKIQKPGDCPVSVEQQHECGSLCTHDLECPSIQKCCNTEQCESSCMHPKNVTECFHQKTLSELLVVNERMGRGYVPQCSEDGEFEPKQCSRNGLVCWCVDRMGVKIKGSMSASENVNCSLADARCHTMGRSIERSGKCETLDCAAVCEYGFKLDDDGCPTCKCDDPCDGYACPEDEECVAVRESDCSDFLCPTLPVCRPKTVYVNPCKKGAPLTDDLSGAPIACALRSNEEGTVCPVKYECTAVAGSTQSVCCPIEEEEDDIQAASTEIESDSAQTMCQYLYSFSENMEGTREGMAIALPQPNCDEEGNFIPKQCHNDECWCVDQFGTEIPKTRNKESNITDCAKLRESMECLDLTCRVGCDYGFLLDIESGCPSCQCRDPCASIKCNADQQCQMVEVSCKDHYCPPVPACLPKKIGQCPYLVPAATVSCDFECNSDLFCNGTQRCCSNGCGTQCVDPLLLTGCQHQQAVALHQAHESGTPAGHVYIPRCKEDGSYEALQCNPGKQECWCVDFRGFEISKTRSSIENKIDCDDKETKEIANNCPLFKCAADCEHGFKIDETGCRTCTCIDPCASITCRGEGETCRLVSVECVNWPCPSVPMCLPKKENPCQTGEPLRLGDSTELVTCGPDYESCPSSHKCQLSPLGEYAVCCPKPRDVCFEAVDSGSCTNSEIARNLTRYYFNSRINKCELFVYSGCQGNHNNFHTEKMCNLVCPVLSQCERLREKNQKASEMYKKPTFTPRCDPLTGVWQTVQCMEHVGVCWCVNPQGEPVKGTLIRGTNPECNFRKARNRSTKKLPTDEADLILEELMMQLAYLEHNETPDLEPKHLPLNSHLPQSRCQALKAQCDNQRRFLPAQCDGEQCWCVDEAGNQLPHTNTFKKGEHLCLPTPVESVDVTIGFKGEYDDVSAIPVVNSINRLIKNMKGMIRNDELVAEPSSDALYVKLALVGSNKVDVAYGLEQMVMQKRLLGLIPDITRSRFVHQLGSAEPLTAERVIALEHREIVSQSPVSMIAPYHTALIVIAAASAFVICTLTLLVILYKRKMANISNSANKAMDRHQRFLSSSRPIYIELPDEKLTPPSVRQSGKATTNS